MSNKVLLETTNLAFCYGDRQILTDINLRVQEGEAVSLIGPSGHGKTTLLQLLAGDLSPTRGTVTKRGLWRRVFQNQALFPWMTVEENIRLGLRGVEGSKALPFEHLIQMLNLQHVLNLYPQQLSGGLRQRTEVARALIGRPDGLLLDEPFSSLDYLLRREMREYLQEFLSQYPTALVLVTHDIPEAVMLTEKSYLLHHYPATLIKQFDHPRHQPGGAPTENLQVIESIWKDLQGNLT